MIYSKDKTKKQPKQNILDYVITNYGKLDNLYTFVDNNEITDIASFDTATVGTIYNTNDKKSSDELSYINNNKIIVSTNGI